jgi:hypothetical protein
LSADFWVESVKPDLLALNWRLTAEKRKTHTNNTYTQCGASGYLKLPYLNTPELCFRFFIDKFKAKSCSYGSVSGEMKSNDFKIPHCA